MSDKVQLIKEEIEKEMSLLDRINEYDIGRLDELNHLSSFIDSFPEESGCEVNCTTKNEDLEEYAKKLAKGAALDKYNLIWMCKKGAEWQKNKMKEALQTEYEKGLYDMREEMMKDAVDGKYWIGEIHLDTSRIQGYDDGDRIKVIPIKAEQQ